MGQRKKDINKGAAMAVVAASAIVGIATWSIWGAIATFVVFGGILSAARIIR